MKKEIKFRVWDKKFKKMIYLQNFWDYGMDCLEFYNNNKLTPKISHFLKYLEIEQFIGLFDKNNKAIFEGDIIKWNKNILVVEWDKLCGFMAVRKGYWRDNFIRIKDEKIIGNIHENPELLKKSKSGKVADK